MLIIAILFLGCEAEKIVYETGPKATFSTTEESYELGEEVNFIDSSVPSDNNTIVSWSWDFGEDEQAVSNEQNPNYIYKTGGTYTITLKVTDNNDLSSTNKQDVTIIDPTKAVNVFWRKPLLGSISNTVSPTLSKDNKTVYMWANQSASDAYDVKLIAYDTDSGDERWAFNVNDALAELHADGGVRLVYASPSVGMNGEIYVVARDLRNEGAARKTFMFGVDPNTGKKKWDYNFGIDANINYITPAIDAKGNVYIGHLSNQPYAITVLNGSTGELIKQIPLEIGVRSGLSLTKTGEVLFCSTGGNGLYAFDTSNEIQKFNFNDNFGTTGGAVSVDKDGSIYTVAALTDGGGIIALNSDGSKKWIYKTPGVIQYGGVIIGADGTLYANGGKSVEGLNSAGIVALNPDGTLKWHFGTLEDANNNIPIIDDRGYVHFLSDDAIYYIIKQDGTIFTSIDLGVKSFSTPVMDSNGKTYLAVQNDNGESEMICLTTGAKSYADSAWPMKGQNPQRTSLQK